MKKSTQKLTFTIIYEEAPERGYVAFVPALPGCHTQGDTVEETEKNIREAIELYLESLHSRHEEIPKERRFLQGKVNVDYPFNLA